MMNFKQALRTETAAQQRDENDTKIKKDIADGWSVPLSELKLPIRTQKLLEKYGFFTVQVLASACEKDLKCIEGLGKLSLNYIKAALEDVGLTVGYKFPAKEDRIKLKTKAKTDIKNPIRNLNLSISAYNALEKSGILYIEDLIKNSLLDLAKLPHITMADAQDIIKALGSVGLVLKDYHNEGAQKIENEVKFPSAFEIANDLEKSKAYLKSRDADCKALCQDIVMKRTTYFVSTDLKVGDAVYYVVTAPGLGFATPHKECALAFILAKWW